MGYTIIQQHVSLSGYKQRFHSSEVSKKMAAVNESDFPLVNKCLELCHALAGQGKAFMFSLTIGSTFTFSLDSREGKKTPLPSRKKKSPSTLRRNAKRKEDFLKKKSSSESASATDLESNQKVMLQRPEFQCDNLSLFLPVQPGTRTGLNTVIWTCPPTHLCKDDEDSEADEVPEAPIICCCGCGAHERCPRHYEVMESRKLILNMILDQTKRFNLK